MPLALSLRVEIAVLLHPLSWIAATIVIIFLSGYHWLDILRLSFIEALVLYLSVLWLLMEHSPVFLKIRTVAFCESEFVLVACLYINATLSCSNIDMFCVDYPAMLPLVCALEYIRSIRT